MKDMEKNILATDSKFLPMPEDITIHNGNADRCDMFIGPCSCGATHKIDDWQEKIPQNIIDGLQKQLFELHLSSYYAARGVGNSLQEKLAHWEFTVPANMSHNPDDAMKLAIYEASEILDNFPEAFVLC